MPQTRLMLKTSTSFDLAFAGRPSFRKPVPPPSGKKCRGRPRKCVPSSSPRTVKVAADSSRKDACNPTVVEETLVAAPIAHLDRDVCDELETEVTEKKDQDSEGHGWMCKYLRLLVSTLEQKVGNLEREVQQKEDVHANLRESLERTRSENEDNIKEYSRQLKEQQEVIRDLKLESEVFRAVTPMALASHTEAVIASRELRSLVDQLETSLSVQKAHTETAEGERAGLLELAQTLYDECEKLRVLLSSRTEEVALCKSDTLNAQLEVEAQRQREVGLLTEVTELKKKLLSLRKCRRQLIKGKLNLKKEVKSLNDQLVSEIDHKERLTQTVKTLKNERDDINAKLLLVARVAKQKLQNLREEYLKEVNHLKMVISQRDSQLKEFKFSAWLIEKELKEDLEEANSILEELV